MRRPSELVCFTSVAPKPSKAQSTTVTYSAFSPTPRIGNAADRLDALHRRRADRARSGAARPRPGPGHRRRQVRARLDPAGRTITLAQATNSFKAGRRQGRGGLRAPQHLALVDGDPRHAAQPRGRGRRGGCREGRRRSAGRSSSRPRPRRPRPPSRSSRPWPPASRRSPRASRPSPCSSSSTSPAGRRSRRSSR